jgi:diguanylate cyclase (GGDEF)-like protein/PAS domain S-box-containing protein
VSTPGLSPAAASKVVDAMRIPTVLIDEGGTILFVNPAASENFGWPVEHLVGRNVLDFTMPDAVDTAIQSLADLAAHDELGIGVPTVFPVLGSDGRASWWAIGAAPLLDDADVAATALWFMPWSAQLLFDESLASLTAGAPLDEVLDHLGPAITLALEAVGTSVHHAFDGEVFFGAAGPGLPDGLLAGDGPWTEAARVGQPRYSGLDGLAPAARELAEVAGIAGCWAIPVPPSTAVDPAVLTVWRAVDMAPVTAHEFVVRRSLRYVQLALVRHAEHEQLAHMATHDGLTGMANRRLFRTRLEEALAGSEPVAVLFLDLDRFKPVNDRHGHATGDLVLVEVADRLRQTLGGGGLLARLGGDEFTALVPGGAAVAEAVASRLITAVDQPIRLGPPIDGHISIGLSVGIAVARPGADPSQVLAEADAALYAAKGDGGGSIRIAGAAG